MSLLFLLLNINYIHIGIASGNNDNDWMNNDPKIYNALNL